MTRNVTVGGKAYQVLESDAARNGLRLITYYPIEQMMKPVGRITWIMGVSMGILLLAGFAFMRLYDRNILLQLQTITEKLRQVEDGDMSTRITVMPDNEFSYVFEQFNRMVDRIRRLIDSIVKEQQLRSRAELRQLQLQINPHFLYNSLSYIVTVDDRPRAVTDMAVHLASYYRYENGRDYHCAAAAVATCDRPDGDFIYHGSFKPYGEMSRDCTLFEDGDRAYFLSASRDNADMHMYRLQEDLLNVECLIARFWQGEYREAPAIVKREGFYYIFSSYCTGWAPNQGKYAKTDGLPGKRLRPAEGDWRRDHLSLPAGFYSETGRERDDFLYLCGRQVGRGGLP